MGTKDFLLEIGCEEIPARFVAGALEQLKNHTEKWFGTHRVHYGDIYAYATPRRLAVVVTEVSDHQEDIKEEVRGPALRIAKTEEGTWSPAAEGFVRKLGMTVDQLQTKEVKGETYVIAPVHQIGHKTIDVMSETLYTILDNIQFPKSMRWNQEVRFIRPVRWLVCLLGGTVVPIEWAGKKAGKWTYGHRFLGGKAVISAASSYVETMQEEFVAADPIKRKERIREQLGQLEKENGWVVPVDEDLLEEVTYLVEYPTALSGQFSRDFLILPKEVLITTMREHQRYFPVLDKKGNLLPFFVTVRNGDNRSLDTIAKGNEKVLRARLADARFFFEEDLKLSIEEANKKLAKTLFMKDMGSMADKVVRIEHIARTIGQKIGMDEEILATLQRAAQISKFSLVTQVVGEFPELEGVMGKEYALHANEPPEVAEALLEHHLPRSATDELPEGGLGTVLSLADKMDTLVCSFGRGIKVTSSQDPHGLRRKATGVVRILMQQPSLSLSGLTLVALAQMPRVKAFQSDIEADLHAFFETRIRTVLEDESIRYDVIDAILSLGIDEPYWILEKAKVLMEQIDEEAFKKEVEAFSRVSNLAAKATKQPLHREGLTESSEHALLRVYEEAKAKYEIAEENDNPHAMYKAITHMVPEINHFFEHVMVMVEDDKIRNNRLSLLNLISQLIHEFAVFEKIVFI